MATVSITSVRSASGTSNSTSVSHRCSATRSKSSEVISRCVCAGHVLSAPLHRTAAHGREELPLVLAEFRRPDPLEVGPKLPVREDPVVEVVDDGRYRAGSGGPQRRRR